MNDLANQNDVKKEISLATGNVISDMRSAYKLAEVMCQAQVIPDAYKNKPSDCMIAIDMANRMGVSPLMVMQSLYVVKGKPSWSGSACMSFIQANPNFKDVTPIYVGIPNTDQMLGYRASSFFARIYCPAVLMGVAVEGEIEDITQNRDRKVVDVL